ncbi:hypothetical protein [uncultured Dysosmobacter sp.]|uniref:hypothetical protein n=1 Tax=uncultured Dysosmobacter sp. TaxID=2591384 RepID=UPI0026264114|nr:hypothetical protein [uncultured Dysosmobacter sp.]
MFAAMADHFIRQIKIARYFYVSQYKQIERVSKKNVKKNQFGAIIDMYLRSLSSGDMSFFETESGKKLLQYIESVVKVEEIETSNRHYYSVAINRVRVDPEKNELNIEKAAIEYEKARQMLDIHNNNALISLLIRFESFLTDYFEWLVKKYPNKYLNEKSIRYSELIKFDFENLKKELSLEAANSIMSQPLDEWLRVIKSHKFDLSTLSKYLEQFVEIYYRRNVIVHNKGKVNRQYLAGIKKDEEEHPLGEKLLTNRQYVLDAFNVSMVIVYGLLYASLKGNKDDEPEYLEFLFSSGFNHMMENDWIISGYIFELLTKDDAQDKITSTLCQINYWISYKNMGHFKDIKEEIESRDFSAMDVSIRMAKEILLENYEKAIPLLDEALLTGMTPNMVETWPLFIQFRKTEHYHEFRSKYAKELEQQIINPEDLNESKSSDKADELHELKHAIEGNAAGTEEDTIQSTKTNAT